MARSTEALARLIEERLQPGADTEAIDRRIETMFGERWCVVFTDMAGFSRRSARNGIVSFLVLIHQMDKILLPIVDEHAGLVLKKVADSHLLLFREPRTALRCCVAMQRALQRHNDQAAEQDQLFMGCGIGWGDVLKLGDEDVFGVEVNFAAKLGEDLAEPYQILLTPAAAGAAGRVRGVELRRVPGGKLGGTSTPFFEAVYARSLERLERGKKSARSLVAGSSTRTRGRR
jgi:adenylate cyclase